MKMSRNGLYIPGKVSEQMVEGFGGGSCLPHFITVVFLLTLNGGKWEC